MDNHPNKNTNSPSPPQFSQFGNTYQPSTQQYPSQPLHSTQPPPQFGNCYQPQFAPPQDQFQYYYNQQNAWNNPHSFPSQPFSPQFSSQHFSPQEVSQPSSQTISQPSPPPSLTQPSPPRKQPSSSKPSSSHHKKGSPRKPRKKPVLTKRTPWTTKEAFLLAECWLDVSEDNVTGNAQTDDTFWSRIQERFNSNDQGFEARTKDALSGKWRDIRTTTMRFCAIYNKLKDEKQSGVSDLDIVNQSLNLYEDETGGVFKWLDVFRLVKDKPKWKRPDPCVLGRRNRVRDDDGLTQEQPLNLDEDEYDEDPFHADEDSLKRPPGKPRPTKSQRTSSSGSAASSLGDACHTLIEHVSHLRMQRAARTSTLREDMEFLKFDTTGMADDEIAFIESKKDEIRRQYGIRN